MECQKELEWNSTSSMMLASNSCILSFLPTACIARTSLPPEYTLLCILLELLLVFLVCLPISVTLLLLNYNWLNISDCLQIEKGIELSNPKVVSLAYPPHERSRLFIFSLHSSVHLHCLFLHPPTQLQTATNGCSNPNTKFLHGNT